MIPLQRLQKILAESGIASRRKAETMIQEGRVTINGRRAQIGDKADPDQDHIKVDHHLIRPSPQKIFLLLNKPKGVITTTEETEERTTVMDLIKKPKLRLFPIGRLDYDAEGLLLLTNDGETAYRLTHPSFQVPRIYQVKVKGKPEPEKIRRLSRGVVLEDGLTAPCRIKPLKETEGNLWVEMVLFEGRNRQVKRMWDKLGHPVLKLKRIGFGGVTLEKLKIGDFRTLQPEEVKRLKDLVADKNFEGPAIKRRQIRQPGSRRKDLKRDIPNDK